MRIILIIFAFISIQSVGQNKSYLELRQEYKNYCEEELIDTITQHGYVNFKIDKDLNLTPKDTIWEEAYCPDYYESTTMLTNYEYALFADSLYSTHSLYYGRKYSEPSDGNFQIKITRDKYCKVKRKKQSTYDFWNWVEKEYLQ